MAEVILHVYDVKNNNSGNETLNFAIVQLNNACKQGLSIGGVFHAAVQVYGHEEWGYRLCDEGSGVYTCPAGKNTMYTYRESIALGRTSCSVGKVSQILKELSQEWPGNKFDLLAKNGNHFCNELLQRLGVPKLPAWINRFANVGDIACETSQILQKTNEEMLTAGKEAYKNAIDAAFKAPKSLLGLSKGARVRTEQFKPKFFDGRIAGPDEEASKK
ncbi:desumoylating isopeptidase 2-like [Olea europaea var. sylvestris]|uniref:desumoylating isopeptidase 2-like n=1 Tax=Olea europaea var. sylvestris TaxID=158386 RepID=UPI000C1CD9A7|nr:desumoylating isopeptidase 2-like [Olea europaea var. sylvestris]